MLSEANCDATRSLAGLSFLRLFIVPFPIHLIFLGQRWVHRSQHPEDDENLKKLEEKPAELKLGILCCYSFLPHLEVPLEMATLSQRIGGRGENTTVRIGVSDDCPCALPVNASFPVSPELANRQWSAVR